MKIEILTLKDYRAAAETLWNCFKDEDLNDYLFSHIRDPNKRQHAERLYFECVVYSHILKGIVLGIRSDDTECFQTIGVWSLPESGNMEDFITYMRCGFYKLSWKVGKLGRDKIYKEFFQMLYDVEEDVLKGAKCYTLVYLGTSKESRGKGNVKELLQYMFDNFIDSNKQLAYLECSSPSNIPLYERYGFTPVRLIHLGKVPIHIMVRGIVGEAWPSAGTVTTRYKYVKPS